MEESPSEVFEELLVEQENQKCFDCGDDAGYWASVNNGIFVCLNCSAKHRQYPTRISLVKSVNLDEWSDIHLKMMKNGGNKKLKQFLAKYNLPEDAPIEQKYKTKACYYYREMLKAIATGKNAPEEPSIEDGQQVIEAEFSPYEAPQQQIPIEEKIFGFAEKALTEAKSAAQKTKEKINDPDFDWKKEADEFGTKFYDKSKDTVVKIGEKVSSPEFSDDVLKFAGKVADGAKKTVTSIGQSVSDPEFQSQFKNDVKAATKMVGDKSKEIWDKKEEYAFKTWNVLSTGWKSAMSVFDNNNSQQSDENQQYQKISTQSEWTNNSHEPLIKNTYERKKDN